MKNVTEKKIGKKKRKLKSLVIFHSANKINNYNGRQRGGKNEREKIIQKNLQVKTRIVDVFLESVLSESFSLLGVTVHFTSLGCPLTVG